MFAGSQFRVATTRKAVPRDHIKWYQVPVCGRNFSESWIFRVSLNPSSTKFWNPCPLIYIKFTGFLQSPSRAHLSLPEDQALKARVLVHDRPQNFDLDLERCRIPTVGMSTTSRISSAGGAYPIRTEAFEVQVLLVLSRIPSSLTFIPNPSSWILPHAYAECPVFPYARSKDTGQPSQQTSLGASPQAGLRILPLVLPSAILYCRCSLGKSVQSTDNLDRM